MIRHLITIYACVAVLTGLAIVPWIARGIAKQILELWDEMSPADRLVGQRTVQRMMTVSARVQTGLMWPVALATMAGAYVYARLRPMRS